MFDNPLKVLVDEIALGKYEGVTGFCDDKCANGESAGFCEFRKSWASEIRLLFADDKLFENKLSESISYASGPNFLNDKIIKWFNLIK